VALWWLDSIINSNARSIIDDDGGIADMPSHLSEFQRGAFAQVEAAAAATGAVSSIVFVFVVIIIIRQALMVIAWRWWCDKIPA